MMGLLILDSGFGNCKQKEGCQGALRCLNNLICGSLGGSKEVKKGDGSLVLPLVEPPGSICILRLSALGDVTHVVPVIKTIQRHWPNTSITWIIGRLEASLVDDLPGVEFLVFDKNRGWRAFLHLRRQLRTRRFDVMLHMQISYRASLVSLLVKAGIRVGFDKKRAKDLQWLFTNWRIEHVPGEHVLDGFFGFIRTLGIEHRNLVWELPIPEPARQFARDSLPQEKRILVINPCSSSRVRNYRNWRPEAYGAVADFAVAQLGAAVVLTGGPGEGERNFAAQVVTQAREPIINLVGRTSIKQLLAVLEKAHLVLCPDTGPGHMANAVGTPVIGLYVTSNPDRTGPYCYRDWVVNCYPQAVRQEFGVSVEEVPFGKRVRRPQAVDLIKVETVNNQIRKFFLEMEKCQPL